MEFGKIETATLLLKSLPEKVDQIKVIYTLIH